MISLHAHQKYNLPNLGRKLERKKVPFGETKLPLALCNIQFHFLLLFFFFPTLSSILLSFTVTFCIFLFLFFGCYSSVFSFIFLPIFFFFSHFLWIFVLSLLMKCKFIHYFFNKKIIYYFFI